MKGKALNLSGRAMKKWYHGTPSKFEVFDPKFIGRGNDQLGSGFYFTDDWPTALGYAKRSGANEVHPTVLTARLDIKKPIPEHGGIGVAQIEKILKGSPGFEDALSDFGDIEFEGFSKVLGRATQIYKKVIDADTLSGLNSISNDFYRGEEARFLKVVFNTTGFDGLVRKVQAQTHAVAWMPDQIEIIERYDASSDLEAQQPGLKF